MKCVVAATLALAFAMGALAQHRGGGGGGGASVAVRPAPQAAQGMAPARPVNNNGGWGNVVFPGTGGPPPSINSFGFGRPNNFRGFHPRFNWGAPVMPFAYPVFVGGFDNPYYYGPPPDASAVQAPAAVQSAPPVIINQYFGSDTAQPVVHEYGPDGQEVPPPGSPRIYQAPLTKPVESADKNSVVFFIALKDKSVYSASAYWVDGETLHYITTQGKHNQVSLSLVDRDLSAKLNEASQVEFRLPASK